MNQNPEEPNSEENSENLPNNDPNSDGDKSHDQGKRPESPVDPLGAMFQQMFGGAAGGAAGGRGGAGAGSTPGGFGIPGLPGGIPGMDPQMLSMVFGQLSALLSGSTDGSAVNWELAKTMARNTVSSAGPDPSPSDGEQRVLEGAVQLAEHWLDQVTSLPAGTTGAYAWSRAQWIESTLPVWKQLVEPVAERITSAMGTAVGGAVSDLTPESLSDGPEGQAGLGGILGGMFGGAGGAGADPLGGMLKQMGNAMFGTQVGQALASLAGEVVSGSDIGLPLGPEGKAVLLPANITAFGEGLGVDIDQVRLYLALREAAYQRLFSHVPWLKPRLLGAVEEYARGITVDASKFTELAANAERMDLTNMDPSQLENMLGGGGMFTPVDSPQQKAALARLETLLALAEGWVDAVVHAAAEPHLPSSVALRETLRRRRAAGGPAEQTFSALVGLELRPRRLRDASRLWASLADARGIEGRDAVWSHPDLLPVSSDLDDPDGFVHGRTAAEGGVEFDFSGLDDLLDGGTGKTGISGAGRSEDVGTGGSGSPAGPDETDEPDGPAASSGPEAPKS